jgi:hypothetical protein
VASDWQDPPAGIHITSDERNAGLVVELSKWCGRKDLQLTRESQVSGVPRFDALESLNPPEPRAPST